MNFLKLNQIENKPWIDYSSLSMYMTCPRKYWWRSIQHITTATDHPALTNGKAYHAAIADYHRARLAGASFNDAVEKGIATAIPIMQEIKVEGTKRNATVAEACLRNYFTRWNDDVSTILHVEVGGAVDLGDFLYVGLIDAIKDTPYGIGINETKTTTVVGDRWQLRGKPNMQIEGYMFMASVLLGKDVLSGTLDVIPIHEDSKKRKDPFRIPTTRTHEELAEWHRNVAHWFAKIEQDKHDDFFSMDTNQCVPLIGSDCPYHIVCKLYENPHGRSDITVPGEYIIKPWLPLGNLISA
jgi:hypothetical protein